MSKVDDTKNAVLALYQDGSGHWRVDASAVDLLIAAVREEERAKFRALAEKWESEIPPNHWHGFNMGIAHCVDELRELIKLTDPK